ncbi:MAG: metallopeptidase TldD-related protein [Candidatus Cloacimonadales bacterium]
MINKLETTLNFIAKHNDADDYSITVRIKDSLDTRFAQNRITQNISGVKFSIDVALYYGKKCGTVSIDQLDEAFILERLAVAKTIALHSSEDKEHIPTEEAKEYLDYNNHDIEIENLTVEDHLKIIKRCIDNALEQDAVVSGMVSRHVIHSHLITKNGFVGGDRSTIFEHSMTIKKDQRETRVSASVIKKSLHNLEAMITELNKNFQAIDKPNEMLPQKIAVILRPQAVIDIFSFMSWFMDRRGADLGMTPFSGQIGKPFFGKNFNMCSTLEDSRIMRSAFDGNGILNQNTEWSKDGVVMNLPTDKAYAKLHNLQHVNGPFNVVIAGGDKSEEEMMKLVDEGLIINRFWYIRVIDGKSGELTGLTRDGVLYFKNGKIQKSVNNFRWNDIPHDMTRRILALGEQVVNSTRSIVPTMLIKDFHLVDNTRF